jgi:hypothetical protein
VCACVRVDCALYLSWVKVHVIYIINYVDFISSYLQCMYLYFEHVHPISYSVYVLVCVSVCVISMIYKSNTHTHMYIHTNTCTHACAHTHTQFYV